MTSKVNIRAERPSDLKAISGVHLLAFGQDVESKLVDALRVERAFYSEMSLVAEADGEIVGHILFTHLQVASATYLRAAALAPLAVLPGHQAKGVAASLVREGLARLRNHDFQLVVVVGDPKYYRRFGFSVELGKKIACPYSGEHLMALELQSCALEKITEVKVTYPSAFSRL